MAMVITPEVQSFALCVKAMGNAKEEKLKVEIMVKESHLKFTEMKEAQEEAKNNAMEAGHGLYHFIHNANDANNADLKTVAETLMSLFYNEKVTEKIFSEAKEKEKKAYEAYETAIYISEVANKKYSDAVNKMELAWKPAQDSVQLV